MMLRPWFKPGAAGALALLIAALAAAQTRPAGWGPVKGKVIWGLPKLPKPEVINATADKAHCEKGGKLVSDKWVVDPKTKGVKNAVVFLVDASNPTKALPIHPSLKALKKPTVEIDQP